MQFYLTLSPLFRDVIKSTQVRIVKNEFQKTVLIFIFKLFLYEQFRMNSLCKSWNTYGLLCIRTNRVIGGGIDNCAAVGFVFYILSKGRIRI